MQSSGAKASSKKQVPSLMLQARMDSVSIALDLDAGCKSNVQSSGAKASSKKQVPSLMLQAREDSVSIALALDAGCMGNRYRVLTSKEQVHRAIFGCQGKLKKQVPSLMLQAREDSLSIALAHDAGCKSNVQSSGAKASSK